MSPVLAVGEAQMRGTSKVELCSDDPLGLYGTLRTPRVWYMTFEVTLARMHLFTARLNRTRPLSSPLAT